MNAQRVDDGIKGLLCDGRDFLERLSNAFENIRNYFKVVKGVREKRYELSDLEFGIRLLKCSRNSLWFSFRHIGLNITILLFDTVAMVIGSLAWFLTYRPVYYVFGSETIPWIRWLRHKLEILAREIFYFPENWRLRHARIVPCPNCQKEINEFYLVSLTGWCPDCSFKLLPPGF